MTHVAFLLTLVAAFVSAAMPASAQITYTAGVYIDADGVLRTKDANDPRLEEIRKKGAKGDKEIAYISLPRLFAEAKKAIEAGQPLSDEIRFLGGLVKIQYVFVYPDEKDIVIAGRAEPMDVSNPMQPIGMLTGRPCLQLDDLVTALRATAPGAVLGCTLDVPQELADRIRAKTKEFGPKAPQLGNRKVADMIAEASGFQPVRYLGLAADNRFALVCIAADYQLKQMELGLLKSPVSGVKSVMEMSGAAEKPHRFAFECGYDALGVSPDGNSYELRGQSLKVSTSLYDIQKQDMKEGEISTAARNFASQVSRHFDELAACVASFADLANLSDLAVVASIIGRDELAKKVGWDNAWVFDRSLFKVAVVAAPKIAATLCNYRRHGDYTIFVAGGVALDVNGAATNRVQDAKAAAGKRPAGADWSTKKK